MPSWKLKRFGQRIKLIRQLNSMTQEELGEEVGVSATYIGMVERGERNPSLLMVHKIAKKLRIPVNELLVD